MELFKLGAKENKTIEIFSLQSIVKFTKATVKIESTQQRIYCSFVYFTIIKNTTIEHIHFTNDNGPLFQCKNY